VVTPAKNLWHCFGCGVGGGPIDWTMKRQGVSFRHAVELLREGVPSLAAAGEAAGAVKRSTVRAPVRSTVRGLSAPVAFDADDAQLLRDTVAYYHERLKQSPEALAYLEKRGIASAEAIDRFRLGVADRTLGLRLPTSSGRTARRSAPAWSGSACSARAATSTSPASLVIPILDAAGHVVELYGRKLRDDLRVGTPKHLYLPAQEGRSRGVFNIEALAADREIILCEALIDALTFWCAGYRNVTTAYGVEGFTDEMLDAMKRHGTQRVLIAFDRDEPGERGAAKVAERLTASGIECWRIQFPKGMDANSYALRCNRHRSPWGWRSARRSGLAMAPAGTARGRARGWRCLGNDRPSALADDPLFSRCASRRRPPAPTLPASPVPPGPAADLPCTVTDAEILFTLGSATMRAATRARPGQESRLRGTQVNLLVSRNDAFYVGYPGPLRRPASDKATSPMPPSNCRWPRISSRPTWAACS